MDIVEQLRNDLKDIKKFKSVDEYINSFDYSGLNRVKRKFVIYFAKKTYYLAKENKLLCDFSTWYKNSDKIKSFIYSVNKFQENIVCLSFIEGFLDEN